MHGAWPVQTISPYRRGPHPTSHTLGHLQLNQGTTDQIKDLGSLHAPTEGEGSALRRCGDGSECRGAPRPHRRGGACPSRRQGLGCLPHPGECAHASRSAPHPTFKIRRRRRHHNLPQAHFTSAAAGLFCSFGPFSPPFHSPFCSKRQKSGMRKKTLYFSVVV